MPIHFVGMRAGRPCPLLSTARSPNMHPSDVTMLTCGSEAILTISSIFHEAAPRGCSWRKYRPLRTCHAYTSVTNHKRIRALVSLRRTSSGPMRGVAQPDVQYAGIGAWGTVHYQPWVLFLQLRPGSRSVAGRKKVLCIARPAVDDQVNARAWRQPLLRAGPKGLIDSRWAEHLGDYPTRGGLIGAGHHP